MNPMNLMTTLALIGAATFWGLSFVWAKIALQELGTFTLVFIRFLTSGLLFIPILMLKNGHLPRLSLAGHSQMLLLALLQPLLYFSFETLGLQYSSASKASLIIATVPATVLLLSVVFLKERLTLASLLSVALSVCGVFMLVVGSRDFHWSLGGGIAGDILLICAVVSAAVYMIFTRSLGQKYNAMELTFLQMLYGGLLFLPLAVWENGWDRIALMSTRGMTSVACLTVLCSLGAFMCYNYALSQVAASRAVVFINAVPLVTVCAAWAILGEVLTPLQAVGGAIVLTGVFMPSIAARMSRKQSIEEPA